jgi:hypothetical protein
MKRVSGTLEINWTVEFEDDAPKKGMLCDDPAKEAVLEFIPQSGEVGIWGPNVEWPMVFIEKHEEDIVIEEDERD